MLGHMGIRSVIANSTPINNKIRIQIMPRLYTTYDMRYTKPLDTIAQLTPRNTSNKIILQTVGHRIAENQRKHQSKYSQSKT